MEQAAIEIITPVLEQSVLLAADYAKACGRDAILSKDFEYAIKYCAMNTIGQKIGSHFPEIYEEDSEESDSEDTENTLEVVDENELEFTPYSGEDKKFTDVNESYERWGDWEPKTPVEEMIKNAIDNNEHVVDRRMDYFD
jgi:histone H3/H4